jgi:YVTN family beta-propeller protein
LHTKQEASNIMKQQTTRPAVGVLISFLSLSSALLLALSGCGGSSGATTTPPPTSTTTLGRFAYVANAADDTISVFIADNTSGQLRHHGYVLTGNGPNSLTIDPSGQFAYTTNGGSSDISLFTIDSLSGELNAADCNLNTSNLDNCSTTNGIPTSLVFEPNGIHAYVTNNDSNSISTFDKNPTNGALTLNPTQPQVTADGANPLKLKVHPSGSFLYATYEGDGHVGIYEINANDGTIQLSPNSPVASGGTSAVDIAISADGQYAYVANSTGEIGAFTIGASGSLTTNGSVQNVSGTTPQALALDSTGHWLYMISKEATGSVSVFEIQANGTLQPVNCNGATVSCATGALPESIAIDPTSQFVTVTNGGDNTLSLFTIDQNTGELTAQRGLASRNTPVAVSYFTDTAAATVTPRFAYAVNSSTTTGNSVSAYTINANSGVLSSIGTPTAAGVGPSAIASDIAGRFAYASNSSSNNVSAYTINGSTGALSQVSGSPFPLESSSFGPESITVDPSGRFVYVADTGSSTLSTYRINTSSGALTLLSNSPVLSNDPAAVSVDPTGRFTYVANATPTNSVSAFSIDPVTGALTAIGAPVAAGSSPNSVAVDPTGRFVYVANVGIASYNISAYRVDSLTGGLTPISGSPFAAGSAPFSITVDPFGEFVYVANQSSQTVTPYTINASTGVLTAGSTILTELNPQSITVDPSGHYVYVANWGANSVSGYAINANTGALTSTGASVATGVQPRSIITTGVVQ